jgi:hypothetical protein
MQMMERAGMTAAAAVLVLVGCAACSRQSAPATQSNALPAGIEAAAPQQTLPPGDTFTGSIVETMNSGGYTYARLQRESSEVWIAGPEFAPVMGEVVTVSLAMPMQDFESKTLNRRFPLLYFVEQVARNGQPLAARKQPPAPAMATGHGSAPAPAVDKLDPPPGGQSIANVIANRQALSGKSVTVRGTVVKFNGGIMDRNWLHLQDGSGSASTHDNDLTVTTDAVLKVGDIVTLSGVLGTNQDFGAGYAYDAILEKASVRR